MKIFYESYYDKLNPNNLIHVKKGKNKTPKDKGISDNLWQRGKGFELIFKLLLEKKTHNFNIVETGTLRKKDNWLDGQSALIWTRFVETVGGTVQSVDINADACRTAETIIDSNYFNVACSDSIEWLKQIDKSNIDLYYLDSFDCRWEDDEKSAQHHLNEFKIIEPYLKKCIVAIDDNVRLLSNNKRSGKGRLVYEYLSNKGIYPVYDDYQLIYKFI